MKALRKAIFTASLTMLVSAAARADDIVVSQWGVVMSVAEFAVALDQGHFKSTNAPVTGIIASQGGGTGVRTMIAANNALGYGVVSLSAAVEAIRRGEEIKIVNLGSRSAADTVLVAKVDSSVTSLADLKGKAIGITSPLGWSDTFAALAVRKAGLTSGDVKRVALGSLSGALTGLSKDAVQATMLIEPTLTMRRGDFRVVFDGRDLPPMAQSVGVATNELIQKKPDAIRAIIEARRLAVRSIKTDPAKAAASMAKHYKRVPVDALEKVIRSLLAAEYWSEGDFEIAAMDEMLDGLRFIGAFKGDVNWDQMIDRSFLAKK